MMGMEYGIAIIGIRVKNGEVCSYCCEYDNEIIPEVVIDENWRDMFINERTRSNMLSCAFQEPDFDEDEEDYMPLKSIKDVIKAFDYDGSMDKDYKSFMSSVKKLRAEEVMSIALGALRISHGYSAFNWKILNPATGQCH